MSFQNTFSKRAIVLVVTALPSLSACGLVPGLDNGGGLKLPPIEAFFVPKPTDAQSGTVLTQAVCADGNDAITDLEARVDALNAVQQSNIGLLKALQEASPDGNAQIATYDVESSGKTLHVQLVQNVGQVAITGTDGDGNDVISGAYRSAGDQGALQLLADDGTEISSAWSIEGDALRFARTVGDNTQVAVSVLDDHVQLAVTESDGTQIAADWSRETREGRIAVDTGTAQCWGQGTNAGDMCDVDCGG